MNSSPTPKNQVFDQMNKWTSDEEYMVTKIDQLQKIQFRLRKNQLWMRARHHLQLMHRLNTLVEDIDRHKCVLWKSKIGEKKRKEKKTKVPYLPITPFWWRFLTYPQDRLTISFLGVA